MSGCGGSTWACSDGPAWGCQGAGLPVPGVVAECGQPGLAAVVVLAPGHRVEGAHARVAVVAALALAERAVVDRGQEADPGRLGDQVVPLVLAGPGGRQARGGDVPVVEDVHGPGLQRRVIVEFRAAEQAAEPVPVV